MTHFTLTRLDGHVVSQHRTPRAALRAARRLTLNLGKLTVHEFPGKHTTGRPVMYVTFDMETDWRGSPLDYWNDGTPVI
jgi:hypothetical protein